MAKKEVAKRDETAVADFNFEGMGTGLENVTAADIIIPRITILQGLSPQLVKTKPEYDKDAKVGDIYDVGLQENFGESIVFLPVHFMKQWLEWAPRNSGKGLCGIHNTPTILDECEANEKGKPVLPSGNYIAETAQFFGFNLSANGRRSFLPMASTQLKKARRLLTLATNMKLTNSAGHEYTPPLFYRTYVLGTVGESNAEGDWIGWTVDVGAPIDKTDLWEGDGQKIMTDIKEFRQQLTSGSIAGDVATMEMEAASSSNDGAM